MALADIPVVYGGPFADETDSLQAEINKAKDESRRPNFSKTTENWETISAGAKKWLKEREDFITVEAEPIVENVVVDYAADEAAGTTQPPAVEDTSNTSAPADSGTTTASDADIFGGN